MSFLVSFGFLYLICFLKAGHDWRHRGPWDGGNRKKSGAGSVPRLLGQGCMDLAIWSRDLISDPSRKDQRDNSSEVDFDSWFWWSW